MVHNILLQAAEPKNEEFLFQLFKESRPDLMYMNSISEEQKSNIMFQQFIVERQELIRIYPSAEFNIIVMNEKPIGRLYIHHDEISVRILQIGLLREYRGLGIGNKVINTIIENAIKENKIVQLQVAWFNEAAYRLYEKIGFKIIENKNIFYEMQYIP